MKKITIAIDGFSSCGKSTMAKDLAREIGYIYIDSGAMYRAVTLYCLRHGLFHGDEVDTDRLKTALLHIDIAFKLNPETGKPQTYLDGTLVENDIRTLWPHSVACAKPWSAFNNRWDGKKVSSWTDGTSARRCSPMPSSKYS